MSWWLVFLLAAGAYAFKVFGLVVVGSRPLPAPIERCLALVPAALLSALVITNGFADGKELVLDERAAGLAVAAIAGWRRAPFVVVVVLAALTTGLLRQV